MNISGSHPIISNLGIQNFKNKKTNYNNLSPLSKDTVSFGSSASAKKMVERFKTYNPNGQYNIKLSEAETIYKYFGYELENGSSHKTITGPYGQTYTYANQSIIDPSNASALIRGIQMADEFNGELILFSKKPSKEQIQEWKQRIAEREPIKGYENSYAIDNRERLQASLSPVEVPSTVDSSKEQDKTINELKVKISMVMASLTQSKEDFDTLVEEYGEIKELAEKNKIEFPQETIQNLDEQIKSKSEELGVIQTNLKNYKEKLSKNNMLSEEEIANIDSYQNSEIDLAELENSIINLENIYTQESTKQDQLTEQVINAISIFDSNYTIFQEQLLSISNLIDEATNFPHMKKGVVGTLNKLYSTIERKLSKISHKVDEYRSVETNKTPVSKLNEILEKVDSINNEGLAASIPEILEINSLLSTEVTPLLTITEDEKAARGVEQIEKFYRRASQAQVPVDKQPVAGNDNSTTAVELKKVEPQVPTEQKIEVPPVVTTSTTTFDPPLAKNIITSTNLIERRTQQLKSKLADKIVPLPLPSVKVAIASLIDEKFNSGDFAEVQNGSVTIQDFAKNLASNVVKTKAFNRTKNSARFAFLNGVYNSSTNKPEEIFGLNGKQSRELYQAIKDGKKEIEVASIKINIGPNINMDEIDTTFNKYNTKLGNIDKKKGEKIADEILKYMPSIPSDKFALVLLKLSHEGTYYELLLNKDCPAKLKTTLLETFWDNFDSENGTNYASKVMENYEEEQKKVKEAEMQKRKLESIKTIDWTL